MGKHITKDERNEISILLKRGYSQRNIGNALNKDHSSISREIRRNIISGAYIPRRAHYKSTERRKAAKYQGMKINKSLVFESYLEQKLKIGWTPYVECMNNTPRKCLDFQTPNEAFNELLAKARKRHLVKL